MLAKALLDLSGLAVTNEEAANIVHLFKDLAEYDKRPITFRARVVSPLRGRFGRTKSSRSGHVGADAVKRYIQHPINSINRNKS